MPIAAGRPAVSRPTFQRQRRKPRKRARTPNAARANALDALLAAKDASLAPKENLMPLLVDAAREYVTLGEMCDALRETMGVYTDPAMF